MLRPSRRRHLESTAITFSIVLPLTPHTGERQTEKQHDYNLLTFFTAATALRKAGRWAGRSRKLDQFSVMGLTCSDISSAQEALTLLSAGKMHSRVNPEPDLKGTLSIGLLGPISQGKVTSTLGLAPVWNTVGDK